MPLKILQINSLDLSGGAAQIANRLHSEYKKNNHLSWLAVGHKQSVDPDVFLIPKIEGDSVWSKACSFVNRILAKIEPSFPAAKIFRSKVKYLSMGKDIFSHLRGMENFRFPGSRQLLQLPPQFPDLIHAHNLHGDYFDLRYLAPLSKKMPVFLTLHDAWLLSGNCAHSFECERWKFGCGQCPDISINPGLSVDSTDLNWARKRQIFKESALYVATPCQWLMDKVRQSILWDGVIEARVIPNGVSTQEFFPIDKNVARHLLGLPENERILLFAANGIKTNIFKDFQTLRQALRRLSQLIDVPIRVIALGDEGDDEYYGSIRMQYVPHTLEKNIIRSYYQSADIYLHPARAETFPNTILEAMACGTPVIATAVGGIPEQIQDGLTGILVPKGDPEEFAFAIKNLLGSPNLLKQMGIQANLHVKNNFTLERQLQIYISWFEEIVAKISRSNK